MTEKWTPFFLRCHGVLISALGLLALGFSWIFRYLLTVIERGLSACWFCG